MTPNVATPARAIGGFLERLAAEGDFPAFAEHVRRIASMSKDTDAPIRELTDVILNDVALTAKILRTANSVIYNRSGDQIIDISYAVMVMGFERVRDLALSAKLFDHLSRRGPGFRQLMVMSLLTANQGQRLARILGYPATEEAYLCGMFHGLGEVMAACYAAEEYGRVAPLMTGPAESVQAVARRVFGFSFEALGLAVAAEVNLPARIVATMRPAEAGHPPLGRNAPNLLARITAVADRLTLVCYRHDQEGIAAGLARLLEEDGRDLELSAGVLQEVVDGALEETKETLALLGVAAGDLHFRTQASCLAQLLGTTAGGKDSRGEPLAEMVRELKQCEQSGRPADAAALMQRALEELCGAGWERAAFALVTDDRTEMVVRLFAGAGAEGLVEGFRIELTAATPLQAALFRHRDLVLGWDDAGLLRGDATLRRMGPVSFAVLPLVVGGVLIGCLYCDHRKSRIDRDHRLAELMVGLRDSLARLFRRRGAGPNP